MSKLKKNLFYWAGTIGLFFLLLILSGFREGNNVYYGLFVYVLGVYLARPFLFKEPMFVPYSGEKLLPKKDGFLRTVLFIIHIVIIVCGLSLAV